MRNSLLFTRLGLCLFLIPTTTAAESEYDIVSTYLRFDCSASTLLYAAGVHDAADKDIYQFRGACYVNKWGETRRRVRGPRFVGHVSDEIKVEGDARWVRATGEAQEKLELSGAWHGTITSVHYDCWKDPFLKAETLDCKPGQFKVNVAATGKELEHRQALVGNNWGPLFRHHFDPAEAHAMSLANAGKPKNAVPPPPEPEPAVKIPVAKAGSDASAPAAAGTPQVALPNMPQESVPLVSGAVPAAPAAGRRVPLQLVVEGEQLVGAASVAAGALQVQDMAPFGTAWSGNGQLFWTGGSAGAVMNLPIEVPEAGNWSVVLRLTRAPDYADLGFEVGGRASTIVFNGYTTGVTTMDAPLGTYALDAGPNTIAVQIRGRQPASTNFFVGLDRIMLTKLDAGR